MGSGKGLGLFFKETPDSGVWLGFSYACLFRCFFSSYCFIHLIIVLLFFFASDKYRLSNEVVVHFV